MVSLNKNKKSLSTVIATVLLILIVLGLFAVIWIGVKSYINSNIHKTQSCSRSNLDKITLVNDFTCFDTTNNVLFFRAEVGDVEIDRLLVSLEGGGSKRSFEIENLKQSCVGGNCLKNFVNCPGSSPSGTDNLNLKKNVGQSYFVVGSLLPLPDNKPDSIRISPIISNEQCAPSDEISGIPDCVSGQYCTT